MFTGIVERTGTVRARTETDDGLRLRVGVDGFDDLHHGQSISVSGVCLTVEAHGDVAGDPASEPAGGGDAASTADGESSPSRWWSSRSTSSIPAG